MGRNRKSDAECVRLKVNAPTGFHSIYTANASKRDEANAAARLRALVAAHGTEIALTWNAGGTKAIPNGGAEPITRQIILSWERRGWVEQVTGGDVFRSGMVVDLDAVPDAP
jgi:hypothetical protein